mgnify:FL=1
MKLELQTVKYVNYDYVIKEIANNMAASIDNMKDIIKNQISLCNYLDKAEEKDKYKDFIKNLRETDEKYEEQIKILEYRLKCMNEVKKYLNTDENNRLASLLLEALGVSNKEGKSIEEREANHEEVKTYIINGDK